MADAGADAAGRVERMNRFNLSGQSIGQKGERTRARLIGATFALFEASKGLPPTAAAIAREAEISPPTFYLYFPDAGAAILAAIEPIGDELEPIVALLEARWPPETLFEQARGFVEAYFDYWISYASALRLRNRLADQGDKRFVELRVASVRPLTAAIADKIRGSELQVAGLAHPQDLASVLVTALERVATVHALNLYPESHRDRGGLVSALAFLIVRALGADLAAGADSAQAARPAKRGRRAQRNAVTA